VNRREDLNLPIIIQGGMGIGVSSVQMANAVANCGQLGVVSGTAVDSAFARRLQDGDKDGEIRWALSKFPDQDVVIEILDRFFIEGGKKSDASYLDVPKLSITPTPFASKMLIAANFVEVTLAKRNTEGLIGINFLEKIQLATPASVFGAILAGVDYILMGAGIPADIPQLITDLLQSKAVNFKIKVEGADTPHLLHFDPTIIKQVEFTDLHRPKFLAIVSSHILANYLARDEETRPDGFVIEGPTAGGHNAPPRSKDHIADDGQVTFSDKDLADFEKVKAVGLPFWLAGGYGTPAKVKEAIDLGAVGVQVGSLFALSRESGITDDLRDEVLKGITNGNLDVRTEPKTSATGFPFKVVEIKGTATDHEVYEARSRKCDLGYLRSPFLRPDGGIGYRCSAEPIKTFEFKGGAEGEAENVKCLCNALMANIGLGQVRWATYHEPALLTLGSDLSGAEELSALYSGCWTSAQVVEYLVSAL
jgi:NAD(P)H-dependent flavin oxidoreductase YrpB (nitropropane dioxygenase family)